MSSKNSLIALQTAKEQALIKKIKAQGFKDKEIRTTLYHIDKLANIIIDSYISSQNSNL